MMNHGPVDVVVLAKDIPAGTVVGKNDLRVVKINREAIGDANIVSDPAQYPK